MASALASAPSTAAAALLDHARSGTMSLPEVMSQASAWQQAGQAVDAAALYEAWLGHTQSPLRHVASFNLGTVLGSWASDDAAEAAYREALALPDRLSHARAAEPGPPAGAAWPHDAALAEWQRGDRRRPGADLEHRLHALNNSARLLEVMKRLPEAEALMRRSLELQPRSPT
jgi:tetratricopeptide (TPR) repeat protein